MSTNAGSDMDDPNVSAVLRVLGCHHSPINIRRCALTVRPVYLFPCAGAARRAATFTITDR